MEVMFQLLTSRIINSFETYDWDAAARKTKPELSLVYFTTPSCIAAIVLILQSPLMQRTDFHLMNTLRF